MNVRNVLILADLIREIDGNHALGAGALAEALASRGVLVPSAMTDAEGYEVGCVNDFTVTRNAEREAIEARSVRSELERIAKGAA